MLKKYYLNILKQLGNFSTSHKGQIQDVPYKLHVHFYACAEIIYRGPNTHGFTQVHTTHCHGIGGTIRIHEECMAIEVYSRSLGTKYTKGYTCSMTTESELDFCCGET